MVRSHSVKDLIQRFPPGIPKLYVWFRTKLIPLPAIDQLLPRKGLILDVGCGFGVTTLYLALQSQERKLIGLDLDSKRIAAARIAGSRLPQVSFEVQNFLANPFFPEGADAILMVDLLHHVSFPTQEKLLDQCTAQLRKGGVLLLKEIDTRPRRKFYWNFLHDKLMTGNQKLYFRPSEVFQQELEQRGFAVRRWPHLHPLYPHVFLFCTKK